MTSEIFYYHLQPAEVAWRRKLYGHLAGLAWMVTSTGEENKDSRDSLYKLHLALLNPFDDMVWSAEEKTIAPRPDRMRCVVEFFLNGKRVYHVGAESVGIDRHNDDHYRRQYAASYLCIGVVTKCLYYRPAYRELTRRITSRLADTRPVYQMTAGERRRMISRTRAARRFWTSEQTVAQKDAFLAILKLGPDHLTAAYDFVARAP